MGSVPAVLVREAATHAHSMFSSVVNDDYEVCMMLVKAGGALAALALDICGPDAQAWLHVGRARGCLEWLMSDGATARTVRHAVGSDISAALARSKHRRTANPAEFAAAITCFGAWLGGAESREALGLDLRAGMSPVIVSAYAEPTSAERYCAALQAQQLAEPR
jgi:hypothetical protein